MIRIFKKYKLDFIFSLNIPIRRLRHMVMSGYIAEYLIDNSIVDLNSEEKNNLVTAALLHDIGYDSEIQKKFKCRHELSGAYHLKENGFDSLICKLVANHNVIKKDIPKIFKSSNEREKELIDIIRFCDISSLDTKATNSFGRGIDIFKRTLTNNKESKKKIFKKTLEIFNLTNLFIRNNFIYFKVRSKMELPITWHKEISLERTSYEG